MILLRCRFIEHMDSGNVPLMGWLIFTGTSCWSQKVKRKRLSVWYLQYQLGGGMAATETRRMRKCCQSRTDWFQLCICCLIILLPTTPRCAVCGGLSALWVAMSGALQQGSSLIAVNAHRCSRTRHKRKEKIEGNVLCTPIKSLIGTTLSGEVHRCHILERTSHLTVSCQSVAVTHSQWRASTYERSSGQRYLYIR